jgi:two-component system CheB/CheR fusion protein
MFAFGTQLAHRVPISGDSFSNTYPAKGSLGVSLQIRNMDIQEVECPAGRNSGFPQAEGQNGQAACDFPVIGIGASAGGLEALEAFFSAMPPDSGMAFIIVQHLSPDFKSLMDELLRRRTTMAIHRVEEGMAVEPNAIYLIPPRKEMVIASRKLHLTDKDPNKSLSLPIDTFFRSLAQDCGEQAVGIVLSGTGSDGSRGARAIHELGGLVIAQDERTAQFDGMPRSVIDAGVADFVLPPQEIPEVLMRQAKQPRILAEGIGGAQGEQTALGAIYHLLREQYGIDFSHYKPTTVVRRIRRRVQMHDVYNVGDYVERLHSDPEERDRLYRDLLIGVTRFFRDGDAFDRLESEVLPGLIAQLEPDEEFRAWVAGCATGEEAYSLAILIHEQFERQRKPLKARVFATDVHRGSLEFASAGLYEESNVANVSRHRRDRYFTQRGEHFQVSAELRKLVVYAPHDVIRDAPFTKLDLVSCRNLLIYLEQPAQKRAIALFHFGLKAGGVLMMGPSETPGELQGEFEAIDQHWRIYRKRRNLRLPPDIRLPLPTTTPRPAPPPPAATPAPDGTILKVYDALLDHFVPPSLLVSDQRKLVHTFAGAGKYLSLANGRSTGDVLDLVSGELRTCLATGIQQATRDRAPVVYSGIQVKTAERDEELRVTIRPLVFREGSATYLQIMLERMGRTQESGPQPTERNIDEASLERMKILEEELQSTRENLQTTIEELETSNEQLQAANEELVASNEELQSTNEELHSVNEELYTVNAEHQRKIAELTQLTDDMDNLLRGTDVGTIFLDKELCIREFTPQITKAFHVLPQDIGRPISNFNHSIRYDRLLDDIQEVIQHESHIEREVVDANGRSYLLRILPYRTKTKVDGAVLTMIDVTSLRSTESDLRRMSKVFMDSVDPIVIEELNGQIVDVNLAVEEAYGWTRNELIGRAASDLTPAEKRDDELAFRERCRRGDKVRNVESMRLSKSGKSTAVLLAYSLLVGEEGKPDYIATISKDISERKRAEMEAELGVVRRDQFLAMLSHELRNPLAAVLSASQVIGRMSNDPATVEQACQIIERQTRQAARLLDDLLDVGRITQGKIELRKSVVDVAALVNDAMNAVGPLLESRQHRVKLELPTEPVPVQGDPARLLQIMENLLTNAVKFTPQGGDIHLRLIHDGHEVRLEVIDSGVGIAAENLEAIFGLFTQLHSSLDRTERGLGVGLSMVRMLAEMHGGSVVAESGGAGQGSRFTVTLPAIDDAPALASEKGENLPPQPVSVLIVEDISDSRKILRRLLSLDGHDVREAADGHAGLAELLSRPPDVALIDVGLPGLNGYEVARIARKNPALNRVRLVALTGYGRPEDREAVFAAGFDEHLVKPVSPDTLAEVLRPRIAGAN